MPHEGRDQAEVHHTRLPTTRLGGWGYTPSEVLLVRVNALGPGGLPSSVLCWICVRRVVAWAQEAGTKGDAVHRISQAEVAR